MKKKHRAGSEAAAARDCTYGLLMYVDAHANEISVSRS